MSGQEEQSAGGWGGGGGKATALPAPHPVPALLQGRHPPRAMACYNLKPEVCNPFPSGNLRPRCRSPQDCVRFPPLDINTNIVDEETGSERLRNVGTSHSLKGRDGI